jgi:hypothetical protein
MKQIKLRRPDVKESEGERKPDLLSGTRISRPGFDLILVAAVLSLAMLAYELLLTRIASVLLTNQYVFLILGVALLVRLRTALGSGRASCLEFKPLYH